VCRNGIDLRRLRQGNDMAKDKDHEIQAEVDANFEAFKNELPLLLTSHPGKYALLHKKKVINIFDTAGDAQKYAEAQYPDGLYSIQQIVGGLTDLGYFSHAMHISSV